VPLPLKRLQSAFRINLRHYAIRAGYHSKPRFLIIGAQKAGTTALFYYLAEHPYLVESSEKEVNFFAPEIFIGWSEHPNHQVLCRGERTVFDDPPSYRRAEAWYHSHFPLPHELGRHRMTFEATAEYLYYPKTAERIFRYDPKMKFVVLLRDPVERAFSAWNMYRGFGSYRPLIYSPKKENRKFDDAVRDEIDAMLRGRNNNHSDYVRRGLYYEQLLRYFKWFERDQMLILDSRELRTYAGVVVNKIANFLGLPEHTHSREWAPMHIGSYEKEMPNATARLLRELYQPHNQRLYELLNHDFGWQ
jgi:hypothetical protein